MQIATWFKAETTGEEVKGSECWVHA